MRLARGFTLLEVLIAIAVTALLGTGAFTLLMQALSTKEAMESRSDALQNLQRMERLLSGDFTQLVDRGIRNEYGDELPPLLSGTEPLLAEFTRTGWRDAAALLQALEADGPLVRRSQLQRVAWRLEDNTLYRDFWTVLDRSQDSEARIQPVMNKVDSVSFRYLAANKRWQEAWPNPLAGRYDDDADNSSASALPLAVEVEIQTVEFGLIRRVYPVAGSFTPPREQETRAASNRGGNADSQAESDSNQNGSAVPGNADEEVDNL